jgi:hypothetical protein
VHDAADFPPPHTAAWGRAAGRLLLFSPSPLLGRGDTDVGGVPARWLTPRIRQSFGVVRRRRRVLAGARAARSGGFVASGGRQHGGGGGLSHGSRRIQLVARLRQKGLGFFVSDSRGDLGGGADDQTAWRSPHRGGMCGDVPAAARLRRSSARECLFSYLSGRLGVRGGGDTRRGVLIGRGGRRNERRARHNSSTAMAGSLCRSHGGGVPGRQGSANRSRSRARVCVGG